MDKFVRRLNFTYCASLLGFFMMLPLQIHSRQLLSPPLNDLINDARSSDICKVWKNSEDANYSYFVSISTQDGLHFCSGALLAHDTVLASYSCFKRIILHTLQTKNIQIQRFTDTNQQNFDILDTQNTSIRVRTAVDNCATGEGTQENNLYALVKSGTIYPYYREIQGRFTPNVLARTATLHVNDFVLLKLRASFLDVPVEKVRLSPIQQQLKSQYSNVIDTVHNAYGDDFQYINDYYGTAINSDSTIDYDGSYDFVDNGTMHSTIDYDGSTDFVDNLTIHYDTNVPSSYQKQYQILTWVVSDVNFQLQFGYTDVISRGSGKKQFKCSNKFQNQICKQNQKVCDNVKFLCGKFELPEINLFSFHTHSGDLLVKKSSSSNEAIIYGIFSEDFLNPYLKNVDSEFFSEAYYTYKSGNYSLSKTGSIFYGLSHKNIEWIQQILKSSQNVESSPQGFLAEQENNPPKTCSIFWIVIHKLTLGYFFQC